MSVYVKIDTPLLRDKYGEWCGGCGKRIEDDARDPQERGHHHHVDQECLEESLRKILLLSPVYSPVTAYDWGQYLVPVHKKCHFHLDAYSRNIANAVAGAYSVPDDGEVDKAAGDCFNKGDYAIAVRLRQCLRYRSAVEVNDGEGQRRHFQFELVAAAGLWFFESLSLTEFFASLPEELSPNLGKRAEYSLFLLNPLVTFGKHKAQESVDEFTSLLPSGVGDKLRAKAIRLAGIASLNPATTRQAEEMAKLHAGPHQQKTSILSNFWALVDDDQDRMAFRELEKIEDQVDGSSWWHYFQVHFARACAGYLDYRSERLFSLLKLLLRAQLVMVTKGLRGWAVPDITTYSRRRTSVLYPGHILNFLVERYHISKELMDEIRTEAIPEQLLHRIWTPPDFHWPLVEPAHMRVRKRIV